ncbi:MAG: TatD family hydrolase [bacterium]|nr:TatD family hydrolase [bacterium]
MSDDEASKASRGERRALGGGEPSLNSFQAGEEGQALPASMSKLPLQLFDTHCHIHFSDYGLDPNLVLKNAVEEGINRMMLVGCTLEDSRASFDFAKKHSKYELFISVGLHPHEGSIYWGKQNELDEFTELAARPEVKAIGEIGLDYFYEHSPKEIQRSLLRFQLDLAVKHDLPAIFHLRGSIENPTEAYDDFFTILSDYKKIRGVVHCFSATERELDRILNRGLYVGLNGIMTFTRDESQLAAAKLVPLDRLVLETDAPYLTPKPFRGTICEPKHVAVTAVFLAELRGEKLENLAMATTDNARKLFGV